MFIRKRHVKSPNGTVYCYYGIVQTYRVDGRPRQKLLYNMGTRATIAECIQKEQKNMDWYRLKDLDRSNQTRALMGLPRQTAKGLAARRARYQAKIDWLKDVASKLNHE